MPSLVLTGWSSTEERSPDGAVRFEERVRPARPVIERSEQGAHRLADLYWQEVEAFTRGLIRPHRRGEGLELRLLGRWTLLRFGAPRVTVNETVTLACLPILGGLLAGLPAGSIAFAQTTAPVLELRTTVDGFVPTRTAIVYRHAQRRVHTGVSRRYFARLVAGASE